MSRYHTIGNGTCISINIRWWQQGRMQHTMNNSHCWTCKTRITCDKSAVITRLHSSHAITGASSTKCNQHALDNPPGVTSPSAVCCASRQLAAMHSQKQQLPRFQLIAQAKKPRIALVQFLSAVHSVVYSHGLLLLASEGCLEARHVLDDITQLQFPQLPLADVVI